MWICRICKYEASRRGNIIRHLKLVHSIDDRDGQNAYRKTNKVLNCKAQTSMDSNEFRLQTPEDELQSRMVGSGIPLSDIQYPERMIQYGRELHRHRARMSEEEEEEEEEERTNPGLYPSEQIEKFGDDTKRKKCHILDCVLDTFPEQLKTKAKRMCDILKCKDSSIILPTHEIVIEGEVDRGSNIRDYIMDSLIEPPVPGTPTFRMLEKENERLKQNLAYYEKALARARGVSRCRKFESIIDGTVDHCDFSDDTDSDESDGDDVTDEDNDEDEYEDDDDDDDDDDEEDEDMEEYEEDDEPSRKRKKKN